MAESDSKNRTPRRDSDAFECPRCGAYAHQEWHELKRELANEQGDRWIDDAVDTKLGGGGRILSRNVFEDNAASSELVDTGVWAMSECKRCGNYSTWRTDRIMYPSGSSVVPSSHEDMPDNAAVLYGEARAVIGISRRAGAALARSTLERLLKTLDPMDGKPALAARIDHVLTQVSSSLGEMLTVIRHTGNKSLHVEDELDDVMVLIMDPEQEEIVELIFAAINDLVDELITRPARTRAVFDRLPSRISSQVGKNPSRDDQAFKPDQR